MNKRVTVEDSLYYVCSNLQRRLEQVPGMKAYLNLARAAAERESEKQVLSVSAQQQNLYRWHRLSDSSDKTTTEDKKAKWTTFSLGILPAQVSCDPVTMIVKLLQLGNPLCCLFNTIKPEKAITIVSSNEVKMRKKAVYDFVNSCKMYLDIGDEDLFTVTDVFANGTENLLRVIKCVSFVLDLDPRIAKSFKPAQDVETDPRSKVVREMIETERKYVSDLETLLQYRKELLKSEMVTSETINLLFPNLNEIVDAQRRFLVGLECNGQVPHRFQRIGSVFLHAASTYFEKYEAWSTGHAAAIKCIEAEAVNLDRSSRLIAANHELQSFLIKPVQRLCKYPLLFSELLKYTEASWPNYNELQTALSAAKDVAASVNEAQRRAENSVLIDELHSRVLDWRNYNVYNFGQLYHHNILGVRDLDAEREFHVYLFEHIIFFFKEASSKKGFKRRTSLNALELKGRINVDAISEISRENTPGYWMSVRFGSQRESGRFVMRFRTDESRSQWETALNSLVRGNPPRMSPTSFPSLGEMSQRSSMDSSRSSLTSLHDKFSRNSSVDEKKRSVSSPASVSQHSGSSLVFGGAKKHNSVILQVNIRLSFANENCHLSVSPNISFTDLKTTLIMRLRHLMGSQVPESPDSYKLKYQDEDGDFVRFGNNNDWQIALEMLEDIKDEEERLLIVKAVL